MEQDVKEIGSGAAVFELGFRRRIRKAVGKIRLSPARYQSFHFFSSAEVQKYKHHWQ